MITINTTSCEETKELGNYLGSYCRGGEVFLLSGDLGTGKTTLLQGLAKGLGVSGPINSPTFNIMKIYKAKRGSAVKTFCHIDAYRLSSAADLISLGLEEMLSDPSAVVAIEWAEKVRGAWPRHYIRLKASQLNEDGRRFSFSEK